jgi:MraZ protein
MFSGFYGESEYKLDEKGRVPLPPKYRHAVENGMVLTRGPDSCIVLYTPGEWEKVAAKLDSAGTLEPLKLRRLKRAVFSTAFPVSMDAQGRITLPQSLREHAAITSDVVISGQNNYAEIWDKSKWKAELNTSVEQQHQIIESLEDRQ